MILALQYCIIVQDEFRYSKSGVTIIGFDFRNITKKSVRLYKIIALDINS
jgi:hypothetical protein